MTASSNRPQSAQGGPEISLTPELIKLVTEKVFALLIKDLQVERERLQGIKPRLIRKGNGK